MKKFFYLALLALISSCAGRGSYQVVGKIQGISTGDSVILYPYSKTKSLSPILSSRVLKSDDLIDLSESLVKPQVAMFLKYKGYTNASYGILFLEDGRIDIGFDEQRNSVTFTGTPLNDIYENYRLAEADITAKMEKIQRDTVIPKSQSQKVLGLVQSERASLVRRTIDANLDNLVGAYLFVAEELPKMSVSAAEERMSQFSSYLKSYKFMQEAIDNIEAKLRTEPGEKYIDISLADRDNKKHTLSDLIGEGKYVLVDFWVSNSPIHQREIPYLHEAYTEFKDRGFEIYGVSLDVNRLKWDAMCEQMPWVNVIRNSDPSVITDYAITNLPTNFLISPEGIIVAKDIRGKQVKQTLEEYLK